MKIKIFYLLGWFFSILISILWTYENPEKIEHIKDKLNLYEPKNNFVDKTISNSNKEIFETNHFKLELETSPLGLFLVLPSGIVVGFARKR